MIAGVASGCGQNSGDNDADDTGADVTTNSDGGGTPRCDDCNCCEGGIVIPCFCYAPGSGEVFELEQVPPACLYSDAQAQLYASACSLECSSVPNFVPPAYGVFDEDIPLCPAKGSYNCDSWNPEREVALTGGVRYVDASFIDDLVSVDRFEPLWLCDDARVEGRHDGYFVVLDANAGELLFELGLRNGDIPLTINGLPLEDYDDAWAAAALLYYQGELSYALTVMRGTSVITFLYELAP